MQDNIMTIRGLRVRIPMKNGQVGYPVDGIDLDIPRGRAVALVGESGCGKSMTARSLMRLLDPPISISEGSVLFHELDIASLPDAQLRTLRGKQISMIFQEPMTALNPSIQVGRQVREAILIHEKVSKKEARERVIQAFRDVGIPEPERRYKSYPHQLSGGLRQRICIAMAMVLNPEFLIADEPTTALDVTVEAQILALMKQLQAARDMSILMITHNLGVVADLCDEVNVMYAGQIVEHADTMELFRNTLHPYTQGLMQAIPRMHSATDRELYTIRGSVPTLLSMPKGCRFADRCPYATDRCRGECPPLAEVRPGHLVRCFREVKS